MVVVWMRYGSGLNRESGSKIWTFPSCTRQDQSSLVLTFPALCISEIFIKMKIKFLFSHFFAVPQKAFKAFLKPFEAPQRSVKIKIWVNFSLCLGLGLEGLNEKVLIT